MDEVNSTQQQHTAAPQLIGFDYQFYIFMLSLLELTNGEKVGFEVKDDIHIDRGDGTTVLIQAKHTVQQTTNGETLNLTNFDIDLWKTLNNWVLFIQEDKKNSKKFIDNNSFIFVTNKKNKDNEFITTVNEFVSTNDISKVLDKLSFLKNETSDSSKKKYIQNIISLGSKKLSFFLLKLTFETDTDSIIEKIKAQILHRVLQKKFIEPVYDSLYSNLQSDKYQEIKNRQPFEISYEEFSKKYCRCFQIAYVEKPLPKREFNIFLPNQNEIENQTFIKQLIDIGDIKSGSSYIRDYTTQMLYFLRLFTYWADEKFLIYDQDIENFKEESLLIWSNAFRKKYRKIEKEIEKGLLLEELEEEICELGIDLIDSIREKKLMIEGYPEMSTSLSNGHFYALSNELKIGWHYNWKSKYKN